VDQGAGLYDLLGENMPVEKASGMAMPLLADGCLPTALTPTALPVVNFSSVQFSLKPEFDRNFMQAVDCVQLF